MATPDYGRAVYLVDDLPAGKWAYADGYRNLAAAVYRRVTTRRGSLKRHPDYGRDLRDLIGETYEGARLRGQESAFAREVEKDERVNRCACSFVYDPAGELFTATFAVQPVGSGTFTLILAVSAITVSILNLAPVS